MLKVDRPHVDCLVMVNVSHLVDECHDAARCGLAFVLGAWPALFGMADGAALAFGGLLAGIQVYSWKVHGPSRNGYGTVARLIGAVVAAATFLLAGGGPAGFLVAGGGGLVLLLVAVLLERIGAAKVSRVLRRTLADWYEYELTDLAPRIAPGGVLEPPFPFIEHPRAVVLGEFAGRPIAAAAGSLHVPAPEQVIDVTEFAFTAIMFVLSKGAIDVHSTPEVRRGVVTWVMTDVDEAAESLPDFALHPRRSGSRQWIDDLLFPVDEFESIQLTERFEFVVPPGTDRLELWNLIDPSAVERLQSIPGLHVRKHGERMLVAIPGGATTPNYIEQLVLILVELASWLESAAGVSGSTQPERWLR